MTHGSLITTVLVNSYMDRPGAGLDNHWRGNPGGGPANCYLFIRVNIYVIFRENSRPYVFVFYTPLSPDTEHALHRLRLGLL